MGEPAKTIVCPLCGATCFFLERKRPARLVSKLLGETMRLDVYPCPLHGNLERVAWVARAT